MAIQHNDGDDDDDIEINPVTMLLLEDHDQQSQEEENEKESPAGEANQELQRILIPSIESAVVIRQIPSEGLSFQLWAAATAFFNLLDLHRLRPTTSPLAAALSAAAGRRLRILELGAGTGLVGIAAAVTLGAEVTVTDLPHVLSNIRFNAEANAEVLAEHGGAVHVAALGWGDEDQMEAIGREYDLIIGTDVVYHDHLYDPLIQTLKFLLLGSDDDDKNVVFLMAHLKRWKKESAFFKMAKKLFEVGIIHTDDPLNGSRIGVVVYRFVRKCRSSSKAVIIS